MPHELTIAPRGHLALLAVDDPAAELSKPIVSAFAENASCGLLHLATNELQASLPPALDYVPLVELLQGKLSTSVMNVVTAHEGGLFPMLVTAMLMCPAATIGTGNQVRKCATPL